MENDEEKAIWLRVEKRGSDECWPWVGRFEVRKGRRWYGSYVWHGVPKRPHRAIVEFRLARKLLRHEYVLHSCDNPQCCNPAHLRVGTQRDNMHDMFSRGRFRGGGPRGERNGSAKLSSVVVRRIREMATTYS